jgi:hypothetical protein
MKDQKLVKLLSKLDRIECKKLNHYICSEQNNSNKEVQLLLDYLFDDKWSLTKNLTIETIWKKVFEKQKFDKQKFYNTSALLLKLTQEFLAVEEFKNDKLLFQSYILKGIGQKKAYDVFEKEKNVILKRNEKHKYKDSDFYFKSYLTHQEIDKVNVSNSRDANNKSIQAMSDYFDVFYLSKKLKTTCEMLNRENILNTKFELSLIDEIITGIEKNKEKLLSIPSISIYYTIYNTLQDSENENHYYQLVKLLDNHTQHFTSIEAKSMYDYAANYCIKKLNQGSQTFLTNLFELFKTQLKNEVMLQNGEITEWDYKNICTVGLRLQDFDWVYNFIIEYKEYLNNNTKENAFNYNLANYHYQNKDYKSSLKLLNKTQFTDIYYNLSSRCLLLRIFYEKNDTFSLESTIKSFKSFLNRNKNISKYQQETHKNLLRFITKLSNIKDKKELTSISQTNEKLQKLEIKINEVKKISNINWLLLKVKELTN